MPAPTYTNFVPPAIDAGNLNELNVVNYNLLGNGVSAPVTRLELKTNLSLDQVSNTSDANKPVSTAQAAAILATPGKLLNVQRFTASGTYTPSSGVTFAVVEVIGGGGAGAGAVATPAGQNSAASAGGSGAYTKARVAVAGSVTVTVGAGGTPVAGAAGGNGTASSFGATITAPGGSGGTSSIATVNQIQIGGGNGGVAGIGGNIYQYPGTTGPLIWCPPFATATTPHGCAGTAGPFGACAGATGAGSTGVSGVANTGGGGGGSGNGASAGALSGGAGGTGSVVVYEYS